MDNAISRRQYCGSKLGYNDVVDAVDDDDANESACVANGHNAPVSEEKLSAPSIEYSPTEVDANEPIRLRRRAGISMSAPSLMPASSCSDLASHSAS